MLRLGQLGAIRHSYDDAYPSSDAVRMLDLGQPAVIGQPSSVFLDNPPLMTYIQALPLLVWRSPWAIYLLITVLNTLAIGFLYDMARQVLDRPAALLAAWLLAVNPWVVHFSRTTWVQSLVPMLIVVACWGAWPFLVGDRTNPRRLLLGVAVAAAMMLTYIQAFGVLLQMAPLALLFRRRIPGRTRWHATAILLIALALYGVGVLAEMDRNIEKLTAFTADTAAVTLTRDGLSHAARLVSGRDFEAVWAADEGRGYTFRRNAGRIVSLALELALGAGALLAIWSLWHNPQRRAIAGVLLVWLGVPILSMSATSQPIHPHYLLLSLPAGQMLAGWALSYLDRRGLRVGLIAVCVGITVLAGANLHRANQLALAAPLNDDFADWPLREGHRVGANLRALVKQNRRETTTTTAPRIVAAGHEVVWRSLSATHLTNLRGIDYPNFIVVPAAERMLYVVKHPASQPLPAAPGLTHLAHRELIFSDGSAVSYLRTNDDAADALIAARSAAIDWPSDVGITLVGYLADTPPAEGQSLALRVLWRIDALEEKRLEAYLSGVYRLIDAKNRTVAEQGGHGQWGYRWQSGDLYVERVTLQPPEDADLDALRLRISLFDPIHGQAYGLRSPDGWTDAYLAPLPSTE